MRWQGRQGSSNIDDRRGGSGPRRRGGRTLGLGGILLILGVIVFGAVTGTDVSGLLRVVASSGAGTGGGAPSGPVDPNDETAQFVSVVLRDTEVTWGQIFAQRGQRYPAPQLVLFRDSVSSACGMQTSATGPFYCPADYKAYIDLSFFDELSRRFGAPGDFAQAYVLAHEVGHHIQNITGVSQRAAQLGRGRSQQDRNRISVLQELQADCYAGIWGHHAHTQRQLLEHGDVEEGLRAAAAIGDDTLARNAGARVSPETFTHGSSEERVRWFRNGLQHGSVERCDTFASLR